MSLNKQLFFLFFLFPLIVSILVCFPGKRQEKNWCDTKKKHFYGTPCASGAKMFMKKDVIESTMAKVVICGDGAHASTHPIHVCIYANLSTSLKTHFLCVHQKNSKPDQKTEHLK
eukprot:NODE_4352_length_671_cov_34.881029_g3709_i0.p1 GENE.NODE_4352_length_671_cov_34.881029_g3709_i0~~NODE_4352_length_671_cov_34.881029_g3709_i0.p1  ORF type:complete len:115 (-),score=7.72 NODE_4352_length_671_cov_34.881029_g3709_i0:201-545(-)